MNANHGRALFIGIMLLCAVLLHEMLVTAIQRGSWLVSIGLILVTTVGLMLFAWLLVQERQPSEFRNVSYAAVIGDPLVLTTIAAITALGWRTAGQGIAEFWKSWQWSAMALAGGLLLGLAFHWLGGKADSQSAVLSERLHDSATSWAHNLGVFPAVAGTLLCTIIPLFTTTAGRSWAVIATVIVVIGWGGLSAIDNYRMRLDSTNRWYFNPNWLDVEMDWREWRPHLT